MDIEFDILSMLADGKFHSGEDIATAFGITRASVWKKIHKLQSDCQLKIDAVTGKGYRIPGGIDLLNKDRIERYLKEQDTVIGSIELFHCAESTNQYLLDLADTRQSGIQCCLAEMQTNGRGRRGRQWVSPYGKSIYLSLSNWLNMAMHELSGLSLVVGVAVAETLHNTGLTDIALKWPNDLHVNEKKLGGILLELQGEAQGPVRVVLGLGLNMDLPMDIKQQIDQPVTDVKSHLKQLPSRSTLVSQIISNIAEKLRIFEQQGLVPFIDSWNQFDLYIGLPVSVISTSGSVKGIYRGINQAGELILETDKGIKVCNAGEVSLRKSDA